MLDVVYLLAIAAFFALCLGYIHLCDRIIGGDDELAVDDESGEAAPLLEQAA